MDLVKDQVPTDLRLSTHAKSVDLTQSLLQQLEINLRTKEICVTQMGGRQEGGRGARGGQAGGNRAISAFPFSGVNCRIVTSCAKRRHSAEERREGGREEALLITLAATTQKAG